MDSTPHEDLAAGAEHWQEEYGSSPLRDADFETMSGTPLRPVYGPGDWSQDQAAEALGWPGRPPYTRGPYASMYRSKLWTMRLFAGFGTACQRCTALGTVIVHESVHDDFLARLGPDLVDARVLELAPRRADPARSFGVAIVVDRLLLAIRHLVVFVLVHDQHEGRDIERRVHVIFGDLVDPEQHQ